MQPELDFTVAMFWIVRKARYLVLQMAIRAAAEADLADTPAPLLHKPLTDRRQCDILRCDLSVSGCFHPSGTMHNGNA
jgi:hypothetical protein